MLTIVLSGDEFYDEITETFSTVGDFVLELEHSLISLSKWESKFQRPFLGSDEKTTDEVLGYVSAMILTPDLPEDTEQRLSEDNLTEINRYIDSRQSATTFSNTPGRSSQGEVITSELIYYWLVTFNIPFECETWHLNRLFSLIRICGVKNSSPKKMSKHELAQRHRDLNAQRRAQLGSQG